MIRRLWHAAVLGHHQVARVNPVPVGYARRLIYCDCGRVWAR